MTLLSASHYPAQEDVGLLEVTVGDVLRAGAARWPQAIALMEAGADGALGRRWTFQALLADSERLALCLLTRYAPGERIAVWAPNMPEWVIVEFAAALAGLTLVTVNPGYQARELKYVVEQSRSAGLFIAPSHRGNPMAKIAADVAGEVPRLREVVDLTNAAALFAHGTMAYDLPEVSPRDPAQIQYTSGTTGTPKGALLHHLGLTNNARLTFGRMNVRPGETVLNFMPMFHTSGCATLTLGAAQTGARMIIARQFDPPVMLDIIEAERAELLLGVPTMLIALLEAQAMRPRDVASLRMAFSGGAHVPPELVRKVRVAFGCGFEIVYGQTESSPVVTQTRADDAEQDLLDTVGAPLPQTELAIRHPRTNQIMPVGETGEICTRGYLVMLGYNDDPAATAAAIDADGWLHTGDLGTMDARGYLRVTGRVKDMIIRGGENLFPAEIESVLLEHPTVAEVAVVGVPDERWGEVAVCFVRSAVGASLDPAALRGHCRVHLAAQKTPSVWIEIDEWPLTGSGKIQKFVLRERFAAGAFEAAGHNSPGRSPDN
jgi:fatty-acyl-CoA synthase